MRVFFTDRSDVGENDIFLRDDNFHHIKNVLRLAEGDKILVKTGDSLSYVCEIAGFEEGAVVCDISERIEEDTELPVNVAVFQGVPKGDKMELVIQKCTELGARKIVPVLTQRSVVKLDDKKKKQKKDRWEKIAENASEQSRRGVVCDVDVPVSFKEAISAAGEYDHIIFPYECADGFEHTREVFSGVNAGESVALFIGPEGGFSDEEVSQAREAGAEVVTLGRRILRTETAALYVLSVLGYLFS